jgi:hypothetical protein
MASTGVAGRRRATNRAVLPDAVVVTMADALMSDASSQAARLIAPVKSGIVGERESASISA